MSAKYGGGSGTDAGKMIRLALKHDIRAIEEFDRFVVRVAPDGSRAVLDYAASTFVPGRPLGTALAELVHRIYGDFEYVAGATTVRTTLGEVLHKRKGVCQDFAHLAVGCLRAVGLPARVGDEGEHGQGQRGVGVVADDPLDRGCTRDDGRVRPGGVRGCMRRPWWSTSSGAAPSSSPSRTTMIASLPSARRAARESPPKPGSGAGAGSSSVIALATPSRAHRPAR